MIERLVQSPKIRSGLWAIGGKLLTSVLAVAVAALLARLIRPESLGVYFLCLSLVSLLAVVAQLGLNQTVVRLVAESIALRDPARARAAVRTVFLLGLTASFVMAAIVAGGLGKWFAIHVFASDAMVAVAILLAPWLVVISAQSLQAEAFRGFQDIRSATVFGGLVGAAVFASALAAAVVSHTALTLRDVIALAVMSGLVSVAIAAIVLGAWLRHLPEGAHIDSRHALSIGLPLMLAGTSSLFASHADILILGIVRPPEEMAAYGAASRIAMLVALPLVIVNAVVPPIIAEYFARGERQLLEILLRRIATWSAVVSFIALVALAIGGRVLLQTIYGPHYENGLYVLLLLGFGQLANVSTGSCGFALAMTGHHRVLMWISVITNLCMVAGIAAVAIPFGIEGVAGIVMLATITQNTAMAMSARKLAGIRTYAGLSHLRVWPSRVSLHQR